MIGANEDPKIKALANLRPRKGKQTFDQNVLTRLNSLDCNGTGGE